MTKIKFCGLTRLSDIEAANQLKPEYIGFIFAPQSRRCITPQQAEQFKQRLNSAIQTAGVFVNADISKIAALLNSGIIDIAQLHGNESEKDIKQLQQLTAKPVIKAFCVKTSRDITLANKCVADYILLDAGTGTGTAFDWNLLKDMNRPYFLAGGLNLNNIANALQKLQPFAVDVSSGIETDGLKDKKKMAAFIAAVRKEDNL